MSGNGYTVEVTNAAAFEAAMAAARAGVADLGVPLAAAAAATVASSSPPRRTGRMAGAARIAPLGPDRVRITVDTPYAAAIHWGWPAHGIRRRPWLVANWMRNPGPLEGIARAIQARIDSAAGRTR